MCAVVFSHMYIRVMEQKGVLATTFEAHYCRLEGNWRLNRWCNILIFKNKESFPRSLPKQVNQPFSVILGAVLAGGGGRGHHSLCTRTRGRTIKCIWRTGILLPSCCILSHAQEVLLVPALWNKRGTSCSWAKAMLLCHFHKVSHVNTDVNQGDFPLSIAWPENKEKFIRLLDLWNNTKFRASQACYKATWMDFPIQGLCTCE